MKANEVPEKIYLNKHPFTGELHDKWLLNKWDDSDIEYTRTDAFIKKACSWFSNMTLEDMEYKYDSFDTSEGWYKMINDFRNYMKRE